MNIELNKKTIILISGIGLAGLLFFIVIMPLLAKANKISREVKTLDSELAVFREALDKSKGIKRKGRFVSRHEVSRAIDEMTKVGAELNINFLSTTLQKIRKPEGATRAVLPIHMNIQSEYEDLGTFLGALERLEKSVMTVREFTVQRNEAVLPKVVTMIIVEIHLKENERG